MKKILFVLIIIIIIFNVTCKKADVLWPEPRKLTDWRFSETDTEELYFFNVPNYSYALMYLRMNISMKLLNYGPDIYHLWNYRISKKDSELIYGKFDFLAKGQTVFTLEKVEDSSNLDTYFDLSSDAYLPFNCYVDNYGLGGRVSLWGQVTYPDGSMKENTYNLLKNNWPDQLKITLTFRDRESVSRDGKYPSEDTKDLFFEYTIEKTFNLLNENWY